MRPHSESRFRLRIPKTRMAILPDVLRPNLKVVFCGTAAGDKSARAGAYYAGPQNKFWDILHRVGLIPRRLLPQEFEKLLDYGIGLTDLIKTRFGADNKLIFSEKDKEELQAKINRLPPRVLAFNGKRAAQEYFGRAVDYGRQQEPIGETLVFVLPSTSAAARRFWHEKYWQQLGEIAADR